MKSGIRKIIRKIPGLNVVSKFVYDGMQERKQQEKIKNFLSQDLPYQKQAPTSYFIGYEPTIRCNLRCQMCYQAQTRAERQDELSPEEVVKMFENIKSKTKDIKLVGGEPFVRQDILTMIDYWDRKDKNIYLQTNCTLIDEKKIEKLKQFKNIRAFMTSLDGPPEVHDKIRGVPGTFARLEKAVGLIRKEMPWAEVSIFATLLLQENVEYLFAISQTASGLGVDSVQVLFEQVYTPEEVEKTKQMFLGKFGWQEGGYRLNTQTRENPFAGVDPDNVQKKLKNTRLRTSMRGRYLNFTPHNYYLNLENYIEPDKKKVFCAKLLKPELRINPKGEVIWCDVIEKSFGNLLEKTPEEIWLSKEYQEFRQFLKNGHFPACARCCKAVYI